MIFGFVFIFGTSRIYAQCKPFEKILLENNPCKIDYDALVLGYLQSALRMADGKVKVWGKSVDNSGNSQLILPQLLDSLNYPAMRGILLRYSIGSDQGAIQMIVLTTQGLFVLGQNGTVINASLTSSRVFQKLIINGKSDGLPSGVVPTDVKMMFAANGALAITTYAGFVYTLLSQNTSWIQVETSNGVPLSNVCVCRGSSNNPNVNFMALKSDNTLWTWGTNTYLGNNTGQVSRIYATQMSKPNALDTIKMIGMTNALSYYALNTAGVLYSLGANNQRQLGDFTTQERRVWIVPKKPNGDSFKDVVWISPNEHDRTFASINVITKTGRLFSWGNDDNNMIGRDNSSATNPLTPPSIDSNQQISFVGTGGNFSLIWKKDSLQHCFVGQKKDGSMGDGTTSTENVANYDCIRSTVAAICPYKPNAGSDQTVCSGSRAYLRGINPIFGQWIARADNPKYAALSSVGLGEAYVDFSDSAKGDYYFIFDEMLRDTVRITVNSKPTAGADQINQCGGQIAILTGTSPATGTWTAQAGNPAGATVGSSSGGIANVSFTNVSAGVYRFIYTASACADTMNVTVTNKPSAGADQINQCGGKSATLTGTLPTTGTWTAQAGNPAGASVGATTAGIATVNFANTSSGIYRFIYTANGCSDTMAITVANKPIAGADQIGQCGGQNAILSGTFPTTGTWTAQAGNPAGAIVGATSAGIAAVNFANTSTGVYGFIYTAIGCSDTMTIAVTNKPSAGADQINQCGGKSATLTGTLPTTGTWTAQAGNPAGASVGATTAGIATANFANTSSGIYRFIYTANGCSDTMAITVANKPLAGADQIDQCGGQNATLTGTFPTTGTWTAQAGNPAGATVGATSAGIAAVNFANTPTGVYGFIYTANGCSDTMTIAVNNKPSAGADQINQCGGKSATLTGTLPATGNWTAQVGNPAGASVGATTAGIATVNFANTSSGIYRFIYTANGCSDTMAITVANKPIAGADQIGQCGGQNATLTGTFPTTGTWTAQAGNPAGATVGATSAGIAAVNFANTSTGVYGFIYTANGCSDTMTIAVNNKPSAGADQINQCGGKSATLTGTLPATGNWTAQAGNPAGASVGATTAGIATVNFANTSSGIYRFIYTANGCSDTMAITVANKPIAGADQIGQCGGQNATLTGTFPTTGTWTAQASNPAGATVGATTSGIATVHFSDTSNGGYQFIYASNSCTDTMSIFVNRKPFGMASSDKLCVGTAATLTGLFPNTGKWVSLFDNPFGMTLGATDSGSAKVFSMDTSTRPFRFEYSANGCSDTIALNSLAKPNAGIDQTGVCGGSQIILNGIAQDTGSWISMNTNPYNYFIDDKKNGWAELRFSDSSNGAYQFIYRVNTCLDTVSIQVNNKPNGGPDIFTLGNKVINLKGQFPDTGTWYALSANYDGLVLDTTISGTANLKIRDSIEGKFGFVYSANGCSDTINVIVNFKLPNNKPIAKDDSLFVRREVIYQLNVVKNDIDVDADTLQVSILRNTKVGSSSVSGNLILYFLNKDFIGTDTLIYQISDSKGGFDTAFVFFIRREYFVNANDDYIRTLDSTVKGNVLDNDNYPIELKTFVRVLIKQASKQSGSFELNSEGEFSYTAIKVQDKYDYVLYQLCAITDEQDTICDYAWIYLQNEGLPVVSDLISPNGDGNNDELVIKDIEKLNNGGMKIYNRMGDLVWIRKVYDNNDPFKGLGMDNENLPTGTYYYLLKYSTKVNGIEEDRYLTGFIELQK